MERKTLLKTLFTILVIFGITTVLYLYTSGYRLQREEKIKIDFKKTGMLSIKSIPEGANIYFDGELTNATDTTIPGIEPGIHSLKISKTGYVDWEKNVEVFAELVTDITAVLVSGSPRLEPLTNTGAAQPIISPSLNKLAYFSKDPLKPGVWVIPLNQGGLSLFKANPYIVIQDTQRNKYSGGTSIEWSPDEKKILVEDANKLFYLVDLQIGVAQSTASPEKVRKEWSEELTKKRNDFLERLEIPDDIRTVAIQPTTLWSPDDKKFLFTKVTGQETEYRVYNMEKPIPIGEKVDNLVFTLKKSDQQPKISWYYDSFHLILTSLDPEEKNRGTISIIRIDGTNKTEIYNNTMYSDNVYSGPGGDKLIMLTTFKSTGATNLYTLGIR